MKSKDHLIRLKRFQVVEKNRQMAQINQIVSEFDPYEPGS